MAGVGRERAIRAAAVVLLALALLLTAFTLLVISVVATANRDLTAVLVLMGYLLVAIALPLGYIVSVGRERIDRSVLIASAASVSVHAVVMAGGLWRVLSM